MPHLLRVTVSPVAADEVPALVDADADADAVASAVRPYRTGLFA
ncbi:hypothetical protein ABZT48_04305 [Streptomyces avermitilis]